MTEAFILAVGVVALAPAPGSRAGGPWLLETADTRLELGVSDDRTVILRLEGTEGGHNWAGVGLAVPLLPHVSTAGETQPTRWTYDSAQVDRGAGVLTLTFRNMAPRMVLKSIWRARPGHGPVQHWMEIRNESDAVVTVPQQESLSLEALTPGAPAKLWWIRRGAANASVQGGTYEQALDPATVLTLPSDPEDGASPVPWLSIETGAGGGLYVGWEFSGQGRIEARGGDGGTVAVRVGNRTDFEADIAPGETLLVPPAFVGCHPGDVEEGSYRLHRFILEKLRPPMPEGWQDPTLMCALYVDSTTPKANADYVMDNARLCREMGFETFMVDAMWFRQVGDWRWDPRRFPEGAKPLERYLHANGLRFALWCAWTNGGASEDPGALSVRGPHGHPGWFTEDVAPEWQPGLFWGAHLCLGCPDAMQWCERKTQALVSEYRLDYLKHDIGPIVTQCGRADHLHHHGSDVSYWSALGYYRVMEELLRQRPQVVLENCSGAGHIKDFGSLQRTHYIATTDTLSNLPDRQSVYDSTYALPPLILQAYTFTNTYGAPGDDPGPYLWRSAMMGAWQIAPVNSDLWTEEQKLSARRATDVYKAWIRPILADAKVHHILPRPDGIHWDGLFTWSHSLERGTVYLFRPASDESERTVPLRGLEAERTYRVWSEDGSVEPGFRRGRELMEEGLTARLPERYTSDLVFVQDADQPAPKGLVEPGRFALGTARATSDPFAASAELSWAESAGARGYRVVVAETPDLATPIVNRNVLSTSLTVPKLPAGRRLYWRVEAVAWGGRRSSDGPPGSFDTPPLTPLPGVTFVSDLDWVSGSAGADSRPFRDTNYLGAGLSIGGHAYPKGVWTHSFDDGTPADIVLDIEGRGFGEFAAEVGLDDASGGGSVQFEVLVDGEVVASSPVLRPRESHRLRVSVVGAKTLTLRVLNGGDGYSCDHSVWGLARFVAEGQPEPLGP